jgi:hypothetical protein
MAICELSPEFYACGYTLTNISGKAVADGAISFFLDHLVSVRVARTTFGSEIRRFFDSSDPEHQRRLGKVITDVAGDCTLAKAYDVILAKVGDYVRCEQSTTLILSAFRELVSRRRLYSADSTLGKLRQSWLSIS